MKKVLNVTYHSSDLFAPVLATSLASLFENNKSFDEIHVYIFEYPMNADSKSKLNALADKYGRNLHYILMPDINKIENLGLAEVKHAGWFFYSYMKLYLDNLLPESVEKVLYLDSDILVVGDLTELWEMDLKGYVAAGVIDCLGEKYYDVLGLSKNSYYCNSGMILENLKAWREKKIGDRVREYCKKNGGYVFFMEQTAFNAAVQGDILILHPKYNMYTMMELITYKELMKLRKVQRYYSKEEIDEAVANPVIIHLTNTFMIPNRAWYEGSRHPRTAEYLKYKALTPWKDEPGFPDKRTGKQKFIQFWVDHLPKSLVISIASHMYNNGRINKISKDIETAKSNYDCDVKKDS